MLFSLLGIDSIAGRSGSNTRFCSHPVDKGSVFSHVADQTFIDVKSARWLPLLAMAALEPNWRFMAVDV